MNNKTWRRAKLIRQDVIARMKQTDENYTTAQRHIQHLCEQVTDGGTGHNGGQGNTRFAYKNI